MRKAKAHLELDLARDVQGKKGFPEHAGGRRTARGEVGSLRNEEVALGLQEVGGKG